MIALVPRSNRRNDTHVPLAMGRLAGMQRTEAHPDGHWVVRRVRGANAGRSYVCPGCHQSLPDSVAHVVAWPAHGVVGVEMRRHWHTPCWAARDHRR